MRAKIMPTVFRNPNDSSVTLSLPKSSYSLIWMHGMCDTVHTYEPFFSHYHSPLYSGARIKLIQAPRRQITINGGKPGYSWFDTRSFQRFSGNQKQVFNFQHLEESIGILRSHVQQEVQFWNKKIRNSPQNPFHRVYVGGFSQGGVLALHYALQEKIPIAGAISFSGHLLKSTILNNFQMLPILLMHGMQDKEIKELQARHSYQQILKDENLVYYKQIQGLEHTMNLQELKQMEKWFSQINKIIEKAYEIQ